MCTVEVLGLSSSKFNEKNLKRRRKNENCGGRGQRNYGRSGARVCGARKLHVPFMVFVFGPTNSTLDEGLEVEISQKLDLESGFLYTNPTLECKDDKCKIDSPARVWILTNGHTHCVSS